MTFKFFRNYRWVRCSMIPALEVLWFACISYHLSSCLLSLALSNFSFWIFGLVPAETLSSQWYPLGQGISGLADCEQPLLLGAGARADGVAGPARLLLGGAERWWIIQLALHRGLRQGEQEDQPAWKSELAEQKHTHLLDCSFIKLPY